MLEYFSSLCRFMDGQISCDEIWLAWMEAEKSDFCRFNQGLIRQNGQVENIQVKVTLLRNQNHSSGTVTLSMVPENDRKCISVLIKKLRDTLDIVPADPFFRWCDEPGCSRTAVSNVSGKAGYCGRTAVRDVVDLVQGIDFVGCLTTGWLYRAFGSSQGHHHWFESYTYCLDYSVYHHEDKAVHDQVSGHEWDRDKFRDRLDKVKERAKLLGQPVKDIKPGEHRVYLSPAAVNALFWRVDFSARKFHEKDTWLGPLFEQRDLMNEKVSISLQTDDGVVPEFQQQGYMRPGRLNLIQRGKGHSLIAGPRTAEKYNIPFTGGEDKVLLDLVDKPDRLVMAPGDMDEQDICARVGNGLYISDLWYVNWSEKNKACMTGMTRYACFEVKNGQLGQPINVMRFDDSFYRMFGENLEELTSHRDTLMESFSFRTRHLGANTLPGVLISKVRFTF